MNLTAYHFSCAVCILISNPCNNNKSRNSNICCESVVLCVNIAESSQRFLAGTTEGTPGKVMIQALIPLLEVILSGHRPVPWSTSLVSLLMRARQTLKKSPTLYIHFTLIITCRSYLHNAFTGCKVRVIECVCLCMYIQ